MRLLITGGSSDIAFAIAQRRIQQKDRIIITSSSEKSLQQTLQHYAQQGLEVSGFVYDFANPQASDNDITDLLQQEPLDGVILNACTRVPFLRKLHALPYEAVQAYINNNVSGNLWLIHRLLPHFLEHQFGRLVLISSLSAATGTSRYGAYCATKAALEGLFLNLAVDYSANNILVNTLRAGLIKTSRTEQFWKHPVYQSKVAQIIPQGTMGTAEQVAEAMDPLLSTTSFITGTVLTVSGGLPLLRSEGALA
jgi:3-oxoacyl-[acyl-carrier protein] reductase